MSIRKRLFLLIIFLLITGVSSVGYLLKGELRDNFAFIIEDGLIELSQILAATVIQDKDGSLNDKHLLRSFKLLQSRKLNVKIQDRVKVYMFLDYYLTNKKGIVVSSSRPTDIGKDYSRWNDVFLTLRGLYGARATRENPKDANSSVYYIGAPVYDQKHNIIGALSVIKNRPGVVSILSKMLDKLFYIGATVSIILIIFGISLTNWITKPLDQIRFFITQLAQGKRVAAPNLYLKDFEELSKQVENLRESLEGKKNNEQYVQSLTHELKSPLTAILGAAELSLEDMPTERREKFLKNIILEVKKGRDLLDKMLDIAKLESTSALENKIKFNLKDLVQKVINALAPLVEQSSLKIVNKIDSNLTIEGDAFLIEQAIRNIIQNAIEFSLEGDKIEIKNSDSILIIQDQGVGIPDFARDKIFNKFYTLERPKKSGTKGDKGTGLGLSFVKEVIELHHGEITIESSSSGTSVSLKF